MNAPALEIRAISKTFGNNRVLHEVDLTINPGEIRGLVGSNGSGKSTLIKILSGFHVPDSNTNGAILLNGSVIDHGHLRKRQDIRFVHQDLALAEALTVAECLTMGSSAGPLLAPLRLRREAAEVQELIDSFGLRFHANTAIADLSNMERTLVAVLRALRGQSSEVRVLILDEVTSTLPPDEVSLVVKTIKRRKDMAVLIVSHRIDEILDICHSVTVLRDGRIAADRSTFDLSARELVESITGTAADELFPLVADSSGEAVLRVEGFASGPVSELDLTLAAGEIVGIASLDPSIGSRVLRGLYGDLPASWRSFEVEGKQVVGPVTPQKMITFGLGLVADRVESGISNMRVSENITLQSTREFVSAGWLNLGRERRYTETIANAYGVVPRNVDANLNMLSGGNQQKAIMAKTLRGNPKVLLLDDPTRGVDVGAKAALYRIVRDAATSGAGVVLASTELDELAHLCHRVLVIKDGRPTGEYAATGLTAQALLELCYLGSDDIHAAGDPGDESS